MRSIDALSRTLARPARDGRCNSNHEPAPHAPACTILGLVVLYSNTPAADWSTQLVEALMATLIARHCIRDDADKLQLMNELSEEDYA